MRAKLFFIIAISLFILCLNKPGAGEVNEPVELLFFYSPHCHYSIQVEKEVMPKIKEKYGGRLKIKKINIDEQDNLKEFLAIQEEYEYEPPTTAVPTILIGKKFLVGLFEIRDNLETLIDSALKVKDK